MIGVFETIEIDENEIFRPNDFTLVREDIYSGEYTTITGKTIADVVGWKYADMTLSWDTLPDDQLSVLTSLSGEVEMNFEDSDGSKSETIIRKGFENAPTRFTFDDGTVVWKDVNMNITFTGSHI